MTANAAIEAVDRSHQTSEPHPGETLRTYYIIFAWLMILLVATVIAGQINLDRLMPGLNAIVALVIAAVKASLVILFFMHVKRSSKLTWAFAGAAFIWLVILLALTFNDYLTREAIRPAMKTAPDHYRAGANAQEQMKGQPESLPGVTK